MSYGVESRSKKVKLSSSDLIDSSSACHVYQSDIPWQSEIDATPSPPTFSDWLPCQVQKLVRPLRVALPCVGIDGCGHALAAMNVDYEACNVFDLEQKYRSCLTHHFERHARGCSSLHLGHGCGDITLTNISDLEGPVDVLMSGPPCPPWAGNGRRHGVQDPRFQVFRQVLQWIIYMVHHFGLLMAVIENVQGTVRNTSGNEGIMLRVKRALEKHVPQFHWCIDVLQATDYMLGQRRCRVFLRGIRTCVCEKMPPTLKPFGEINLKAATLYTK